MAVDSYDKAETRPLRATDPRPVGCIDNARDILDMLRDLNGEMLRTSDRIRCMPRECSDAITSSLNLSLEETLGQIRAEVLEAKTLSAEISNSLGG